MPENLEPSAADISVRKPAILRTVGRILTGGFLLVCVALIAGSVALLYPYLRDDWALDQIVQAVALDWRDFGKEKAVDRLRYEFSNRSIGRHVTESNCTLMLEGKAKVVRCDWGVEVQLPGDHRLPLTFKSEARIGVLGDLR